MMSMMMMRMNSKLLNKMMMMLMMMRRGISTGMLKVMIKETTEITIMLKIILSRSLNLHSYSDRDFLINVFSKVPEMVNRMTGVDVTNVRTIHEKYL